ncbi:MAG: ABC transporter substrate-binding protein [Promethearchaeota archaeon]
MKSTIKIIIMASITFGTVGVLYFLDSILIDPTIDSGTKIFVDSLGREVEVPQRPERIISMAPVITETLYAIGVDDRVVGVTDYCNYPEEAKNKPSIGGFSTPNLEIVVSLEPDLVISSRNDQAVIESLENYDIAIVVLLVNTLEDAIERIEDVGYLVDEEITADKISDTMETKMNVITSKTNALPDDQRLKCYFEVWSTPKVAGKYSFLHDMMERAGGINIFGDIKSEWASVTHESVIEKNPEVIFITAMGRDNYQEDIGARPGYNNIDAIINDRIYVCDDDKFTRAGPRIIDALEEMTLYLHPTLLLY